MSRTSFKIALLLLVLVCGMMPLNAYGAFVFGDATAQTEASIAVADEEEFMLSVTFDSGNYGFFESSATTLVIKVWNGKTITQLPSVTINSQGTAENKTFIEWQLADQTPFTTQTPVLAFLTVYATYQ